MTEESRRPGCLQSALEQIQEQILAAEIQLTFVLAKITDIERQLPTVVHEFDKERREKLEERLEKLKAECDDLGAVKGLLVADHEEQRAKMKRVGC